MFRRSIITINRIFAQCGFIFHARKKCTHAEMERWQDEDDKVLERKECGISMKLKWRTKNSQTAIAVADVVVFAAVLCRI
jgi:hypothetical protein